MPPATMNPLCNGRVLPESLHNVQPQTIAVSVISIPYIMDFMLNAMFCDPVENPVPTKNRAKPKFLKELRHCDEI